MGRFDRWAACCALAAGVTLAYACATKQDVVVTKLRGRAEGHVYPVTFDQAWRISKTIFRLEPTEAIEEHRPDGYLLTSQNAGGLSAGTYIGVFIEPGERAGESKVTFIAKRKTPTQAYVALDDVVFHKKFAELVGLIGSVGSLPAVGAKSDAGATPDTGPTSPLSDAGAPSD